MATPIGSEEESSAVSRKRVWSWLTGRAEFIKEALRAAEEARSASVAAREASERAAEAAAETQATVLKHLNGAATEANEESRGTPEEELGKLLHAYLKRGRWRNISIPKMLTDLDDEAGKLLPGVRLAVDTILSADRNEKDAITAGPMKVLTDWQKRALELEEGHHQAE